MTDIKEKYYRDLRSERVTQLCELNLIITWTNRKKDGNFPWYNLTRSARNSDVNSFADGVLCFNIKKEDIEHYQEIMTELEKAGELMCMSKESSPFSAVEDMPCTRNMYRGSSA